MATSLRNPPGLCEVCGVYVPFDKKRPNALHLCPGKRVVPRMPGSPGRFDELLAKLKAKKLADEDLEDDENDEFGALLKQYKDRFSKERLKFLLERADNRTAIERLAEAGRVVLAKYDAVLPAEFVNAVRTQFVNQSLETNAPCTCFLWHKRPESWVFRFSDLGIAKPTGEVSGMTPFWDNPDRAAPARLAGNFAPLNRSIEFPEPKLDTLIHEMIHWCTSPEYDAYTRKIDGNDQALVREGTTEWLKCNAMGVWGTGGYKDVLPVMQELIQKGVITELRLTRAYLGGVDVPRTVDALIVGYHAQLRGIADRTISATHRLLFNQVNGDFRFAVTKRAPEYRERVFQAFLPLGAAERASTVTDARWLKYLTARAAGGDDATAMTKL